MPLSKKYQNNAVYSSMISHMCMSMGMDTMCMCCCVCSRQNVLPPGDKLNHRRNH